MASPAGILKDSAIPILTIDGQGIMSGIFEREGSRRERGREREREIFSDF